MSEFSLILLNLLFQIGSGLRLEPYLGDAHRILDSRRVVAENRVILEHLGDCLVERAVGILEIGVGLDLLKQIFVPRRFQFGLGFLLDFLSLFRLDFSGFLFSELCKIVAAFLTIALCRLPVIFRAILATSALRRFRTRLCSLPLSFGCFDGFSFGFESCFLLSDIFPLFL